MRTCREMNGTRHYGIANLKSHMHCRALLPHSREINTDSFLKFLYGSCAAPLTRTIQMLPSMQLPQHILKARDWTIQTYCIPLLAPSQDFCTHIAYTNTIQPTTDHYAYKDVPSLCFIQSFSKINTLFSSFHSPSSCHNGPNSRPGPQPYPSA